MGVILSPFQEIKDDFRMQVMLTPSPVQEHESNSRIKEHIGTYLPMEAKEPSSSLSKARSKFHIASSYMYLTPTHAVWKWGEPAPSPENSKQVILCKQQDVYQKIHGHISKVYMLEAHLSKVIDTMIEDLKEA